MRCMTACATDTGHGDIWAFVVRFYVRQPCVSDITWSTGNGSSRPVETGTGTSSWVTEEKGSGWMGEVGVWMSSR